MTQSGLVHIIDDDEALRESLESLVRSVGHQARLYGSAAEFLGSDLPDEPSCLLLDVRLPGANGLDFQASLQDLKIFMPVILMTGYGDIQMSVRGMKAGAIDFLTKPFRHLDVLEAVAAALVKDRARRVETDEVSTIRQRYLKLTPRERQVLELVTAGKLNKQTASELGISEVTVKIHRGAAMKKMQAESLADAVKMTEVLRLSDSASS